MDIKARMSMIESELNARFGKKGRPGFFRAPGRVDIMGSHTDYNEGFILAASVDRDIMAGARKRPGGALNLYSINMDLEVRINLDGLVFDSAHGWANYAKGVIRELIELKAPVDGLDLVVHGEIPVGGNLSSSAALEAVVCEAVLGLADYEIPPWERVQLCLRAENLFVGLPCGIMDQFTVFMGGMQKALLLDCKTLDFEALPFHLENAALVVIDSGQGRELAAGKYTERVKQCREAVEIIRKKRPDIKALRDAEMQDIEDSREQLGVTLYKRAWHVVSENQRVKSAGQAIENGNLPGLGAIMEAGYQSSKNDYDNSTPALDALHDAAAGLAGVHGVRICGAGWGGCLLALMDKDAARKLQLEVLPDYRKKTGLPARAWEVEPSPGAGPLEP